MCALHQRKDELLFQGHVLVERRGQPLQGIGQGLADIAGHAVGPGSQQRVDLEADGFDTLVMPFHQVDDRIDLLGRADEQVGPQDRILAGMMLMHDEDQQPDVVRNDLRAFLVVRSHPAGQPRQQRELPPDHRVDRIHTPNIGIRAAGF